MGNWHCIPSSCAEVVYQEYLPPVVRWRYPGESWKVIEGSDLSYTLEFVPPIFLGGQCLGTAYYCTIEFFWAWANVWRTAMAPVDGTYSWLYAPIQGYVLEPIAPDDHRSYVYAVGKDKFGNVYKTPLVGYGRPIVLNGQFNVQGTANDLRNFKVHFVQNDQQDIGTCGNSEGKCTFTVRKNNQIVHQEVRAVCPEVEKLPCRLSNEIKRIEINKLPFLEKVEVVPYAYSAYKLPGVGAPIAQADPIPDQCLNIYNNAIFVIPPPIDALKDPDAVPFDSFIAQICSAPECPPPQYQVLCDSCGCQECPPGTRAVACGNSICCYGSDGVSVLKIPTSDYCGGGDCD